MKTGFSFKYNGEKKEFYKEGTYEIDKNMRVTAKFRKFPEFDAEDWIVYFENTGDENSFIISDICDSDSVVYLDMSKPKSPGFEPKIEDGDPCVISMNGCVNGEFYCNGYNKESAEEFGLKHRYFKNTNIRTFQSTCHRSSDEVMPFFDVCAKGSGAVVAIGWTGGWKAEFEKLSEGFGIKTGLLDPEFYLKPGEKIRTSSTLIMKYSEDEDKYNKFRKLIKKYFSHKACTNSDRDGLLAFELWGGLPSDEMINRLNELKEKNIAFEDIWIDAAWYGHSTNCISAFEGDWSLTTGDWFVNKNSHPDGLKDVAKCANAGDMKLMLWFEPERVREESEFFKAHPEWLLRTADSQPNCILYYGNEEAYEYVYNMLSTFIEDLNISCYRQDFNTWLTPYYEHNDEKDRKGIIEIKHIMGMYRLWDSLLERFPHLVIDNCSSGGRRIDIETLKRSIPFFRSDYQCNFNEDSDVLQTHNAGIAKYLPYNGCTSKTKADTYAVRSAYSSSYGGAFYNASFQSMTEEDFAWAKKSIDEYRRIRKYFSEEFYNHGSEVYDKSSWAIWQYHDPETASGIVMAFRRENSPFETVKIKLSGVAENSKLNVENLNNENRFTSSENLEITLKEKRSSVIFEYSLI